MAIRPYASRFMFLFVVFASYQVAADEPAVKAEIAIKATAEGRAGAVPTTIEEVKRLLEGATSSASAELTEAENDYTESILTANQQAIEQFALIARQQVASGNLPKASDCWEEVLDIDPHQKDAVAFFRTIDRSDVVNSKRKAHRSKKATSKSRRIFQTADKQHTLKYVSPDQWVLNDSKPFQEEWRTAHTIALLGVNDKKRYRIHRDMLYGREKASKWYEHGRGEWVR